MNIAANFSLTDNEIAEIKASDQTTLIDADRWGTDANPEGRLVFVCDGSAVTVVSAEQTIAGGWLDMSILATGHSAISLAETDSTVKLHKYADPTEGALHGLALEDAYEVARIDPSLLYATR